MSASHVSTSDLLGTDPSIRCWDCRKRLTDSPDHETWTRLDDHYFCPQCSQAEGIGATAAERQSMEEAQGHNGDR